VHKHDLQCTIQGRHEPFNNKRYGEISDPARTITVQLPIVSSTIVDHLASGCHRCRLFRVLCIMEERIFTSMDHVNTYHMNTDLLNTYHVNTYYVNTYHVNTYHVNTYYVNTNHVNTYHIHW